MGHGPGRRVRFTPALFTLIVAAVTVSVLPWMSTAHGGSVGFLPTVIATVACFDLLSVYLLLHQFRSGGDPRILAMSVAYVWSLVVMLRYAAAFPGVLALHAPLASAPSVAPWLYVLWHGSFPVLLALAWAPWPAGMSRLCPLAARRRLSWSSQLVTLGAAGVLVAVIVRTGPSLPVLIRGVDTSRMTMLTAPVVVPLVLLSAVVTSLSLRLRRRTGPERWTSAAVWVCLFDLVLTYASGHRYTTGWYTGRFLTVTAAAAVVLLAMLHETTRLKDALAQALEGHTRAEALQRSILDNLHESVLLTDLAGRVLLVNAAARTLFPGSSQSRV